MQLVTSFQLGNMGENLIKLTAALFEVIRFAMVFADCIFHI